MGVQGGYYQGSGQTPLQPTAELVANDDLQRAANASAEFFNKSNALGHAPEAKPIEPHDREFDSAKHRDFMRSLG